MDYIYETVHIAQTLAGLSEFTKQIDLPFIPDEVTVNNVCYNFDGTEAGITLVHSDIINNKVLCAFYEYCTFQPTTFQIVKPIRGSQTFRLRYVTGAIDASREGELFVSMTFKKYTRK